MRISFGDDDNDDDDGGGGGDDVGDNHCFDDYDNDDVD